jgi:hypothetical protein
MRAAGALCNEVTKHYSSAKLPIADENDRLYLKANISNAITGSVGDKPIRKLLEGVLLKMARTDFPSRWPNMLGDTLQRLNSAKEMQDTYGCLLCIKAVIKSFEWVTDSQKNHTLVIQENVFPYFENIALNQLENYDQNSARMVNMI